MALLLLVPVHAHSTEWDLDVDHTNIEFKVKHLMISNVKGKFKTFEGTLKTDGDDISTGKLDVVIQIRNNFV